MRNSKSIVILFIICTCIIIACRKDKAAPSPYTDENFYKATQDTSNTTVYQNGAILPPLGGSPHGSFQLWFNYKAASVLDASNELPVGQTFPDSSFIVKVIYSGANVNLYAIMFKNNGSWLWGEYNPSGDVIYSIANAGGACVGCHSANPNRDKVLTFDLH